MRSQGKTVLFNFNICCSVTKSCLTLCFPINCSASGSSVLQYLLECAQTHVHCIGDVIQPSHSLSTLPPPALRLSQHHGLLYTHTYTLNYGHMQNNKLLVSLILTAKLYVFNVFICLYLNTNTQIVLKEARAISAIMESI